MVFHNQKSLLFSKIILIVFVLILSGCMNQDSQNNHDQTEISEASQIIKEDKDIRLINQYDDYLIVGYIADNNKGSLSIFDLNSYQEIASVDDDNVVVSNSIICYEDVFYLDVIYHKYLIDIEAPVIAYDYQLNQVSSVDYDLSNRYAFSSDGKYYISYQAQLLERSELEIRDSSSNEIVETIQMNDSDHDQLVNIENVYFSNDDQYLVFLGSYSDQEDGYISYGRVSLNTGQISIYEGNHLDLSYMNEKGILYYDNSSFEAMDIWTPIIFYDVQNDVIDQVEITEADENMSYFIIDDHYVILQISDSEDTRHNIYLYDQNSGEQILSDKDIIVLFGYMDDDQLYIIYTDGTENSTQKIIEVDQSEN